MIVKALAENTSVSEQYENEHGLSLYIETQRHKILFDTGRGSLFLKNAEKMDVDIADVDIAVISHGHFDHSGGLRAFLENNQKAAIYIHERGFDKHYAKRSSGAIENIGIDIGLRSNGRIVLTGDYLKIDDELELFSDVRGKKFFSSTNQSLTEEDGRLVPDSFSHEQNLIVTEHGKTVLFAGCAHKGIVNILDRFREIKHGPAFMAVGGFHLYNLNTKKSEDPEIVTQIGKILHDSGTLFYTCHCTGFEAFHGLKKEMGDKIRYLSTGQTITI